MRNNWGDSIKSVVCRRIKLIRLGFVFKVNSLDSLAYFRSKYTYSTRTVRQVTTWQKTFGVRFVAEAGECEGPPGLFTVFGETTTLALSCFSEVYQSGPLNTAVY